MQRATHQNISKSKSLWKCKRMNLDETVPSATSSWTHPKFVGKIEKGGICLIIDLLFVYKDIINFCQMANTNKIPFSPHSARWELLATFYWSQIAPKIRFISISIIFNKNNIFWNPFSRHRRWPLRAITQCDCFCSARPAEAEVVYGNVSRTKKESLFYTFCVIVFLFMIRPPIFIWNSMEPVRIWEISNHICW